MKRYLTRVLLLSLLILLAACGTSEDSPADKVTWDSAVWDQATWQ